jgi:hypothetical protein
MSEIVEAKLSDEIVADIVFTITPACPPTEDEPEGWPAEVEILDILPRGVVPPITPRELECMAHDWLYLGGGYHVCCRRANDGGWE